MRPAHRNCLQTNQTFLKVNTQTYGYPLLRLNQLSEITPMLLQVWLAEAVSSVEQGLDWMKNNLDKE